LSLGLHKILDCIKKNKPNYLAKVCYDLFSWQELETLINIRPLTNVDRFHTTANHNNIGWQSSPWVSDHKSIPADCIKAVVEQGVCWISDMSRANKNINSICNYLEKENEVVADAHIYFDLNKGEKNTSLNKHWDRSDNIIVQVAGQTNFKIWDMYLYKGERQVITDKKPILDIILNEGDIIYIPKNIVHQATSLSKRLSISFPMSKDIDNPPQTREWINISCKK